MAKKTQANLGEFAFFQFLWTFYTQNRGAIRKNYRDLSKKYLDFNDPDQNPKAFLRQPQYEALEVYIFLKEFLDNKRIEEIFKDWFERTGKFAERTEGGVASQTGQIGLFEGVTQEQYKIVFAAMRKNARTYPNYIFALTMGTGKTILMATCIFYEFILANKWKKDEKYCHNALVFSPDKTVLLSLRELETFDLAKVVPPEYVNFLTAHIRFHFLEEAGTSLDTLDQSMFNVIVSNTQKIILKRQHKKKTAIDDLFGSSPDTFKMEGVYGDAADLYNFDQPEDEAELTTNQRFEKLTRLGQLGIFVDEAHHAFGKALAKDMGIGAKETDTSLRTTIDKLATRLERAGTHVVACYNYTGTPYVGKDVLPEVVYAYSLRDAIANEYLKKVTLHGYSNSKSEEFVRIAIDDFLTQTENLKPEGMLPKMAFFAATIDEVQNELRPAVEKILAEKDIPASRILVNVGDPKITSNDDIREFIRLDTPQSEKQFILLVNKGREGWNCRSLFSVGLFRKPKSKIFVLQATMRCLRAIGDFQHTGHVYLSEENLEILNDELQQNFRITAEELEATGADKEQVKILVNQPPVKIKLHRVRRSFLLKEKVLVEGAEIGFNRSDKSAWAELTQKYHLLETVQEGMNDPVAGHAIIGKTHDLTHIRETLEYSELMLVSEIARYLNRNPLEVEHIVCSTKEGMDGVLDAVNEFNELLYDVVIPQLFGLLYDLEPQEDTEEHEVDLIKIPKDGYYQMTAAPDKIVRDSDPLAQKHPDKSFHLDTYCFDSSPERTLFWDLLQEKKIKKVYFTGMLTHGQSDFFIQYIDPESHTVRSYYPDFLFQREDGSYVIVEVKGDNMINDPVVQAKKEFAQQIATASGMEYEIIKGSDAEAHGYRFLL